VPGDAWSRRPPRDPEAQLAVMRRAVAELIANGQPPSRFGDNLYVDLDLSAPNLPVGTRLRVGEALVEMTAEPTTAAGSSRGVSARTRCASSRRAPRATRTCAASTGGSSSPARLGVGDPIAVLSRG
jgi:hypothetical protein